MRLEKVSKGPVQCSHGFPYPKTIDTVSTG
jgi:hypothetical protein